MVSDLTRSLIQLPLVPFSEEFQNTIEHRFQFTSDKDWATSLETLDQHRITSLVAYHLQEKGLLQTIPTDAQAELRDCYEKTHQMNVTLLLTLDAILKTFQARGIHSVVWKGAVLADSFYPDLGTRQMGDLDFSIAADEMELATDAFKSIGFHPQSEMETPGAVYFQNALGILCDVHHRVKVFEGKESLGLTTKLEPQHMTVEAIPVLEPNAMIVHLVVHMDGHFYETGPMLQWIFDIAFVLRKWHDHISFDRLHELMPHQNSIDLFFRMIRFLETEFGENLPNCLSDKAKSYPPLQLDTLLRQRRLALWELFDIKGWVKLGLCRLGTHSSFDFSYPTVSDMLALCGATVMNQKW